MNIARSCLSLQRLRAHTAGETAVKYDQETPRRDTCAPLSQRCQRYCGSLQIEWLGVIGNQLMCLGAVTREGNYHNIVRIGRGEAFKLLADSGDCRLGIHQQNRVAAEGVSEKRMQSHRIAPGT